MIDSCQRAESTTVRDSAQEPGFVNPEAAAGCMKIAFIITRKRNNVVV